MGTPAPVSNAEFAGDPDSYLFGLGQKKYPAHCPPCKILWFHAVDVPKRKPQLLKQPKNDGDKSKSVSVSKKFIAFSHRDSGSIESRYQGLLQDHAATAKKSFDVKVPVKEDLLFDVDIAKRELAPAYWLGPIYEVRRGSWFYPDGTGLRPCEETLASQLEEGYLETKPWIYSGTISEPPLKMAPESQQQTMKGEHRTYNLAGAWLNNVVTYADASTAWLISTGVLSLVASAVYEKFAGRGYLSGVKVVRGYSEPKVGDADRPPANPMRSNTAPFDKFQEGNEPTGSLANVQKGVELLGSQTDSECDNDAQGGSMHDQETEHLVLVTHGIGQSISMREDSLSFVGDIDMLRKTLKTVYTASSSLRSLNSDHEDAPWNCRVQVLPVCWRHLIAFPERRNKHSESRDGEDGAYESEYPRLEDITLETVPFARSLISDLALDVLLFQSSYREQLCDAVLHESNRLHRVFLHRNPNFRGKVHVVGYSLGSLIAFELLCRQGLSPSTQEVAVTEPQIKLQEPLHRGRVAGFGFAVEDFFCLGSPVGLFQMVKGRTIAARRSRNSEERHDPYTLSYVGSNSILSPVTGHPFNVSSPKVSRLFNIFHPSDPISYRMEPLISPAMSRLKPQSLPYTKKGLFEKVGQTMSGFFPGSSGQYMANTDITDPKTKIIIASTNGSYTDPKLVADLEPAKFVAVAASRLPTLEKKTTDEKIKELSIPQSSEPTSFVNADSPTQSEVETLSSILEKRDRLLPWQNSKVGDEEKVKLRQEEMKVRALNRNGRVDYCLQTGILNSGPLDVLTSHLSYWSDEDVCHFILKQLLS